MANDLNGLRDKAIDELRALEKAYATAQEAFRRDNVKLDELTAAQRKLAEKANEVAQFAEIAAKVAGGKTYRPTPG
jgi:DNA repair exonuclease SbcCD ATPase subunit